MCDYIKYTWEQFDLDIQNISQKLRSVSWVPEVIVGIVRGGAVPAICLSHSLNVPDVRFVEWSNRNSCNKETKKWDLICAVANNKKVLVVEDIIDSGVTLEQLKERSFDCNSMKYAAMWYNIDCPININFWANTISRKQDERWLRFPWENYN